MTRTHTARILVSLALTASIALPATASDPSRGPIAWVAGLDFTVGNVDFSLGFFDAEDHHGRRGSFGRRGRDREHHRSHDRSYFYVTSVPLSHAGHECGPSCFLRDDRFYHHPDCPVVLELFASHGFDPYPAWRGLPDGGFAYYRSHHGPELYDDHHGRRGRGRHGRDRHD
jgi:hypothetical protein